MYGNSAKLDEAPSIPHCQAGAALSLVLWAGLVFSGRLIAFDAQPGCRCGPCIRWQGVRESDTELKVRREAIVKRV